MDSRPLEGITVVELCQNVAGPYAGLILGTLGARVVKVEHPDSGDVTRGWAPPYWGGDSVMFGVMNAGKESHALDLTNEVDRQALREHIDQADVVLASWRPGTLERLGFGYEALAARNPGLVYCSISGFGRQGPLADAPGFDPLIQAFTGLMWLTGEEDGQPVRTGTSIIDMGTGLWAVIGILSALRVRGETGRGTEVSNSLFETGLAWLPYQIAGYLASGEEPARRGSALGMLVPYQAFATSDRLIVVAVGNDSLWQRFCTAIGRRDLGDDPDLATNPQRVSRRDRVIAELARTLSLRSSVHWEAVLAEAGVPCSVVQTVGEAVAHPHTVATGVLGSVTHPQRDGLTMPSLPFSLGGNRLHPAGPAPRLGQHASSASAQAPVGGEGGEE